MFLRIKDIIDYTHTPGSGTDTSNRGVGRVGGGGGDAGLKFRGSLVLSSDLTTYT